MVTGMPLHKALNGLREELELAQSKHGETLRLQIDSIELELTLELGAEVKVEGKGTAEAKIPWLVVGKAEAGGAGAAHGTHTHRVSLTITPLAVVPAAAAPPNSQDTEVDVQSVPTVAPAPRTTPLLIADNEPRIDRSAN